MFLIELFSIYVLFVIAHDYLKNGEISDIIRFKLSYFQLRLNQINLINIVLEIKN